MSAPSCTSVRAVDADAELADFLSSHAAHDDLIRGGFIREVAPKRYQVTEPPAIIAAIRAGTLTGRHLELAAMLLFECRPPKGFWFAESPDELIERIRTDQPL